MIEYYHGANYLRLKETTDVMFEEISSGVYYVSKYRTNHYPNFVTSDYVVNGLNSHRKVVVKKLDKNLIANYKLKETPQWMKM